MSKLIKGLSIIAITSCLSAVASAANKGAEGSKDRCISECGAKFNSYSTCARSCREQETAGQNSGDSSHSFPNARACSSAGSKNSSSDARASSSAGSIINGNAAPGYRSRSRF